MSSPAVEDSRVLVVEDDALFAEMVAEMLSEAGYDVVGPFPDLAQSCEALREEEDVSAAVLDISLREGTSFPLADRLTAEGIPLVFYTSRSAGELPRPYRAYPIVSKTAPAETLLGVLETLT